MVMLRIKRYNKLEGAAAQRLLDGAKQLNAERSGERPLSHGQHWSRGCDHGLVVIFHVVPQAGGVM